MKILIADDEPHVRNGLKKIINWEELGIEQVFSAENGEEALRICKESRPEIVLTDIRMPGLDGLEMAKRALSQCGVKKILIMSGYSDFEYAKTALQLGAVDYLLKPVNVEELKASLCKSVEAIRSASRYNSMACDQLARQVLEGLEQPETLLATLTGTEHLDGQVVCCLLSRDRIYKAEVSEQLICEACSCLAEKLAATGWVLIMEQDYAVWVYQISDYQTRSTYQNQLRTVLHKINSRLGNCSMGISKPGEFGNLHSLYRQAHRALKRRMYQGGEQCFFYEMEDGISQVKCAGGLDGKAFKDQVYHFKIEAAQEEIAKAFEKLYQEKCTDNQRPQVLCVLLQHALVEAIQEKGIDTASLLNQNQTEDSLPVYDTLSSYEQMCRDFCSAALQEVSVLSQKHHSAAVEKAVWYMNHYYYEDITLKQLAERVDKSTNYLSAIFKKEMCMNFNEYLNEVRIRHAQEILATTDKMIYEVAEMVGYSNYRYFTKVFKKIVGYAPSNIKNR